MDSNTNTLPQAVERPALRSGDLFGLPPGACKSETCPVCQGAGWHYVPVKPKHDPDHYLTHPMDNQEAVHLREIDALRAENEQLKIKLSRMCGDA